MNEAETRAEHIDPALRAAGWGVIEGSRVMREYRITRGSCRNAFSAFEDSNPGSLVRIAPDDIRKKRRVPKNGSVFFTIFQTFMSVPVTPLLPPGRGKVGMGMEEQTALTASTPSPALPLQVGGGVAHPERDFYFGEYPPDFFDFIVIDECHRGGANDESTWGFERVGA